MFHENPPAKTSLQCQVSFYGCFENAVIERSFIDVDEYTVYERKSIDIFENLIRPWAILQVKLNEIISCSTNI